MRAMEIGRRLAQLGQRDDACQAYALALDREPLEPLEKMEAAVFLLESGGDYRPAYDAFLSLCQTEEVQEDAMRILTGAFYEPNRKDLERRYEKNVKALKKYRWLFRRDFPAFDRLPLLFFPYDDETYVPFDTRSGTFLPKFAPRYEEISRNFFHDLENPILASDVFSQYELEYLNDNVRRSEDVGRENHIYLHYTSWEVFCSYLQVWNLSPLLKAEKAVFLFEDQSSQYPIDFKARFGLDYSQYPLKPVGIREVTRLIWHTQLSAHNGGDFFNEIFDNHPNLLFMPSVFLGAMQDEVDDVRAALKAARNLRDLQEQLLDHWENPRLVEELFRLRNPTDKDLMVALYLGTKKYSPGLDPAARIAPAVFFQPHFLNIVYNLSINPNGDTVLSSLEAEALRTSPLFHFPYIKTFTPLRRFTSSYGGSVRFALKVGAVNTEDDMGKYVDTAWDSLPEDPNSPLTQGKGGTGTANGEEAGTIRLQGITDLLSQRVRNRSFLVDPSDRLFRDSILVRLEDGKLNPEATLTRLAAFLDLPYTDTMTYCSAKGRHDPVPEQDAEHYAAGFSLRSVYNTYDKYVNRYEKLYIEYLMRDAYQRYGYDFLCYDGSPVDEDTVLGWTTHFDTMEETMRQLQTIYFRLYRERTGDGTYEDPEIRESIFQYLLEQMKKVERETAVALMAGLRFVNREGVPLEWGRLLEPDPALLVKPLYH